MAKVALITGAGSGIGRAVARALGGAGYEVALAGRRRDALEETLGAQDGLAVPTDVRDEAAVAALFQAVKDRYGRLDLLFNNAGLFTPPASFEDVPLAKWQEAVDTNLTGAFLCAREAFRLMKAQEPKGGRIINNGSISAHVPRPHAAPYTATKHAITGLTKQIILDGRAHNIACGQIDIGNAATGLLPASLLQPDGRRLTEPTMDLSHVVEAVLTMARLPLEANVPFMTVMATAMPYSGRG